jgi:hypothetical protein
MLDEIWKDVIGYEGLYQISSKGRVLSLERFNDEGKRIRKERMLSIYKDKSKNYCTIGLTNNEKETKTFNLPALIAKHFHKHDPNTKIIYKDKNWENCSADNIDFISKLTDSEEDEIWKPIPGYEGIYEISNHCRIWRLPKTKINGANERGNFVPIYSNEITKHIGCNFYKDGKKSIKHVQLWKLMVLTFIGINHTGVLYKDNNNKNCRIENLLFTNKRTLNVKHRSEAELIINVKNRKPRKERKEFIFQSVSKPWFGFYIPDVKTAFSTLSISRVAFIGKIKRTTIGDIYIKGFKICQMN